MPTRPPGRPGLLDADGPLPWDLVRAIPRIRRDTLGYLAAVVAEHGDLVSFPLPRTPVLLVNDPQVARRVLQDNHRGYDKQTVQYSSLSMVTGSGMIVADGPQWRQRRRLAQPAFHHGELTGVATHTVEAASQALRGWLAAPGASVDVDAAMVRMSLQIVARALFDDDLADAGEQLVAAVADALEAVVARAGSPLPAAQVRSRRRLQRAVAVIDRTCAEVIARRRARGVQVGGVQVGGVQVGGVQVGDDLLGLLLRATPLDDGDVRDELVSLVIAGHETVASSLTWALWLLADDDARGGQAQARVHAELDAVLGDREGGPGWADLPALVHTRAVMDEALRLYPPVWLITRRAQGTDQLGPVPVPEGTLVIISPWLLHRRAQSWPRAHEFDPTRFTGTRAHELTRTGDYLPFGTGPRLCIGRDFALVETVLVLATLLRRHRVLTPAGAARPEVKAAVSLRPRDRLVLQLRPRAQPR